MNVMARAGRIEPVRKLPRLTVPWSARLQKLRAELIKLHDRVSTTTIYVTHDQAEAMTLASRVAVMRKGRLQQFDTPMNIYNRPVNRFVAEFVGSPSMNFIKGRLDAAARAFTTAGLMLPLKESQIVRLNGHEQVTLGIRPEHVHVASSAREGWLPAGPPGRGCAALAVRRARDRQGARLLYIDQVIGIDREDARA